MLDTKALAAATAAIVREHVDKAVAPLITRIAELEARQVERGEKGEPGERGADGAPGRDGADGAPGRDGMDGVGIAGALIDRGGHLILTLTDGTLRDLGPVVGKDGAQGERGADGFGWEDMTEELEDDGRTIVRRYRSGDDVREFRHTMAVVIDRGVYQEGKIYQAGDGVTWARHYWIAREATDAKPAPDGGPWRLAVKSGRDGKDFKPVEPAEVKPVRFR